MGLDTTHDAWHGPYSSFNIWRTAVAQAAGFHVPAVGGQYVDLDWGHVTEDNLMGKWKTLPHGLDGKVDYLLILIAHSDCDGKIKAKHCKPLANRLHELVPFITDPDVLRKTDRFIQGLNLAAQEKEDVMFR